MERRELKDRLLFIGMIAFCTVVVFHGVYEAHSSFRWVSFHQDMAHKAPNHYRAQLNASKDFYDKGLCAFSLAYAQQALRINDMRLSAYLNAATAASCVGAYHLAYQYYDTALEHWPCPTVVKNLMVLAQTINKTDRVEELKDLLSLLDKDKTITYYLDKEPTDE